MNGHQLVRFLGYSGRKAEELEDMLIRCVFLSMRIQEEVIIQWQDMLMRMRFDHIHSSLCR